MKKISYKQLNKAIGKNIWVMIAEFPTFVKLLNSRSKIDVPKIEDF